MRQMYDKAADCLSRALAVQEPALGQDHPVVIEALQQLGLTHWAAGKKSQAMAAYRTALERVERRQSGSAAAMKATIQSQLNAIAKGKKYKAK